MTCTVCGKGSMGTRCLRCGAVPQTTLRAVALLGLLGCSGEPETPHPPIPDEVEPEMMKAIYGPPPVEVPPPEDEVEASPDWASEATRAPSSAKAGDDPSADARDPKRTKPRPQPTEVEPPE